MKAPMSLGVAALLPAAAGILTALLAVPAGAWAADDLGKVVPEVLGKEDRADAQGMIDRDVQRRMKEFNVRHRETWYKIKTREQWEEYRDERIGRLRRSLGEWPTPGKPNARVTGVVKGDGFTIENVVYESRPGFWVTGNLYGPARAGKSMPGILIAHAHHGGKRDSELQDMGMTWARAGCLVLVIDQVGYGERRSHPFQRDADYPKPYRAGRQDYFFRYDTGIQLQLLGDSLMGWFAWDLMRGVDVLLARDGIDPKRIILLGAVAGGGDPAGVTAALDPRITCCVPFNFGGPQPETKYPLPDDAETSFNYLLFTYWDSTRGLRLGASGDFPHWVITASIAPRYLIHGHEFSWDGERDPVWKRYQKVWGEFYKAEDRLGVAHGKGLLKLRPPEASHCNNIGEFHRRMIHPLFEKWFDIKATEYHAPRPGDELLCLTEQAVKEIRPKSLNDVMADMGKARVERARSRLEGKSAEERRKALRAEWGELLGPVAPARPAAVKAAGTSAEAGARVERLVLEVEPGILVPVVVLSSKRVEKAPIVIGLAQAGKAGFLKERAGELQKLLDAGVTVVLPDLRGTGETQSGTSRGKDSAGTDQSVHVQLFGETLLGQRLRDLRSVIAYLRTRPDIDAGKIALWGDSFAPTNSAATTFKVPHGVDGWPGLAEPLGGLLGLLGALFEEDVCAVFVSGGLTGYQPVLTHFAVLVPHDACVPGALTAGDLCDLAGALAPRPLHLESLVDHLNRPVSADELRKAYAPTVQGYSGRPQALTFVDRPSSPATWLVEQLK
jgi:cephalosporin-C deacetylase-like acetyl esterase